MASEVCGAGYIFDHKGWWANHKDLKAVPNIAACAARCNEIVDCIGFHFNHPARHCWIYHESSSLHVD